VTQMKQAPASLVAGGGPPSVGHPRSPHSTSCLATSQNDATLSPAEGWTTSDGRSLKTGFIGLSEEVSDVKEPTFVQEASPPSGGSGPPALIAVVRHEEPLSSSRNVQGWGTAFGEGRVVGSPLNREAPSSPVRAGGGVVTLRALPFANRLTLTPLPTFGLRASLSSVAYVGLMATGEAPNCQSIKVDQMKCLSKIN